MITKKHVHGLFLNATPAFIDELATELQGKKVLEIFAGNGFLANELSLRGVDVKATSILSSMDGHDVNLYCEVENIDAIEAVHKYGASHDVLLMSFPTVTESAIKAVFEWGEARDVVYIGERSTRTEHQQGFLAGCASDSLHYSLIEHKRFSTYETTSPIKMAIRGKFDRTKLAEFLIDNNGCHYWC
ncbi:hypothetical protein [Vibrio sp. D431a]|uniref:hypothetical protein n=1 Tax=Vibrio sp. D431a TaxID=2837388 RepID=UPI0025535E92|nr:hypothetical protein [Vibrio sp. D431a]MDK9789754.1 hypothetical protein [Vibrio sp. D431a]